MITVFFVPEPERNFETEFRVVRFAGGAVRGPFGIGSLPCRFQTLRFLQPHCQSGARLFGFGMRRIFPLLQPGGKRLRRFSMALPGCLPLPKRGLPVGQLERLAAAVKLVIVLALFHITGPCAFKHVPLRFELPFAGQFQILLPFHFAFPLPVNLRRLLRNRFRRPEHAGYLAHNLAEQTDRMLFHFKTGMLVVKPFPVLPHPAKRRGITQHRLDLSHCSFSASRHILIAEVRKQFRFPLPGRFRKRQHCSLRNLPVADQIMDTRPFAGAVREAALQMFFIGTV